LNFLLVSILSTIVRTVCLSSSSNSLNNLFCSAAVSSFRETSEGIIRHWLKQFNLRQVQYFAGHRFVSSTEAYLVNNTEDLQKDIDEFYPF